MPSTVKSYLGAALGSVGYYGAAEEVIPEGPPTWLEIPDQDTNFKDLPATLNVARYVRANPEVTDWATDVGTIDADGVLTIPEGTPIDSYTITVTATNALGTTASDPFTWVVSVEDPPLATLYVNSELAAQGHSHPSPRASFFCAL